MSEILKKLDEFGNAVLDMRKSTEAELAGLRERIEVIETGNAKPRKAVPAAEYKVFHTANGPVYELPAKTRLQDVPEFCKATPEISYERWLAAAMLGERCGDKDAVKFAVDQKQMVTTSTGVLIPQEFIGIWIDNLRAQMVLNAAGVTSVIMEGKKQTRAAVTVDPTSTWHTEAGAISAENPTFAARDLTATTLVTRCQASVELAQDSPDFGRQLSDVMARSMATELDRVGLIGSGTPPEPHGILATSGLNQVTTIGVLADYSKFITAVQKLLDAGVPLDIATANAIMGPNTWARLENLPTGITSDKTQLPRPRSLQDTRFHVTAALAPSGSPLRAEAFMGDFSKLLLGIRREASIELVRSTDYAGKLVWDFVGYGRFDYLVARPKSFVELTGIVGT